MLKKTNEGLIAAALLALFGACADEIASSSEVDDGAPVAAQTASSKPGSGGAGNKPVDYNDPDLKCYRLTAYASPTNKTQKYNAPTTPDLYVGFNIKAPWSGTQYIKSFRSLVDNKAILHHWLLYRNLNGGNEGIIPNQLGIHPDAELLYGWAPGTDDLWLDPDVGMAVPAGSVFQLETHYNNKTGGPAPDASGVEICVTPKKPAHVAGLSYVGSDAINGMSATGTCTHQSKEPVKLIMSFPHMHTKGINMKVDWTHADGRRETIHDKPFDFNYQRTYVYENVLLQPGDKLTTLCTYGSPARWGKGTNDEMCYFFAIHWPAGALARSSLATLLHGPNTCMD